jgi:hypothetical protein
MHTRAERPCNEGGVGEAVEPTQMKMWSSPGPPPEQCPKQKVRSETGVSESWGLLWFACQASTTVIMDLPFIHGIFYHYSGSSIEIKKKEKCGSLHMLTGREFAVAGEWVGGWIGHPILPTSHDNSVLESASITPLASNNLLRNATQPLHPLWCVCLLKLVFRAFGRSRGGSSATVSNSRNLVSPTTSFR